MSETIEKKPFHESIIRLINGINHAGGLQLISTIIKATKIPDNHGIIITALVEKASELDCTNMSSFQAALESLEEQKAEAIKKNNLLFPGPYMEKGSTGAGVALVQFALKIRGLNSAIIIDGEYGNETERGVRQLQSSFEIEGDGKFGPDTRESLYIVTGVDVNILSSDLFKRPTVTVPPDIWQKEPAPI